MSKLQNSVAFSLPQVSVPDPYQAATNGRKYVDFGYDNGYPSYLADLSSVSPTHSAIMEAKVAFLNASLEMDDNIDFKLDLDDLDDDGSNVEDFLTDVFTNLGMFDGAYIEVIYNKTKTRIVSLKALPYEAVRVGRYNEQGVIEKVFISPDWSRKFIKRNAPIELPTFNPSSVKSNSQVMIIRTRKPNQPYYPIPGWVSAMQWVLLDDDVAEYSRNAILNGFTPSTIFNFHNGEPTEDDKSELESYMKGKFTGKNSSKFMMFFDNNREQSVDITTLDTPDLAKYWESISPIITDKIFTGHKIYPSLVGVPVSNGLSSNTDELLSQYQIYLKSTIVPLQKLVLSMFKKILKFNTGETDTTMIFVNELIQTDKEEIITEENTEDNITEGNVEASKETIENTSDKSDDSIPEDKKKPLKPTDDEK